MKSIVVREMVSLILRPVAPTTSTSASSSKHIRFDDTPAKAKGKDTKGKDAHGGRKEYANVHAAYYATITFNQIVLSPTPADRQVARQLIDVYFDLFKDLLGNVGEASKTRENGGHDDPPTLRKDGKGQKGTREQKESKGSAGFAEVENSDSRHISAILTGVNRALPFAKLSTDDVMWVIRFLGSVLTNPIEHVHAFRFNQHVDTLFLITHTSTFNISLQALLLIYQVSSSLTSTSASPSAIVNRYYRTLYASLHDPRLATSSKQAMYLNLVFKSLKADESLERVAAFMRRFVQLLAAGGGGGPEFTAGGLYVVGEVRDLATTTCH